MKAQPYICPTCRDTPECYYGRLVFPEELPPADPPACPCTGHRQEDGTVETVLLVPAKENHA